MTNDANYTMETVMFLCQMSGIPGAGKSTLARRICKMTGAVLLDMDVVKSSV